MRIAVLATVASSLVANASASTIAVVPGQSIQAAIDAATDGDVVEIAPGFYHEAIDFKGKAIRVTGVAGAASTTISAHTLGADVVRFVSAEAPSSVLSGVTITGAIGLYGGIRCVGASPRIEHCRILGNGSKNNPGAGGIYQQGGSISPLGPMVISHCEITFNRGAYAGGIRSSAGRGLVIEDCTIAFNKSYGAGGGLMFVAPSFVAGNILAVERTAFVGNEANDYGGGALQISAWGQSASWTDCTFADNVTPFYGGGLSLHAQGTAALPSAVRNCTFLRNRAASGNALSLSLESSFFGPALLLVENCSIVENPNPSAPLAPAVTITIEDDSRLDVRNSIVRNAPAPEIVASVMSTATLDVAYCDVAGGFAGSGNFDADPHFVDLAGGDLHLTALSPCRNAGSAALVTANPFDLEGDPRVAEGAPDVGADEFFPHLYFTGTFAAGSTSNLRVIGPPGAAPSLLIPSLTLAPAPVATPYGPFLLGFPLVPGFPLSLGSVPATGLIDVPILVPPGLPSGLSLHNQVFLGPPASTLTALTTLTFP